MDIRVIKHRSDKLYNSLFVIWKHAVTATHTFLTESETEKIASYVPYARQE